MSDVSRTPSVEPRATTGGAIPILRVASLERSIAYYVAQLGFAMEWQSGGVASVRRDRTAVMLCEGDQGQSGTWLWISTSNVDALYSELAARGALLRHAPANYPWGSRECQVTDADGHVLRFGADLEAGEPMGEWLMGPDAAGCRCRAAVGAPLSSWSHRGSTCSRWESRACMARPDTAR